MPSDHHFPWRYLVIGLIGLLLMILPSVHAVNSLNSGLLSYVGFNEPQRNSSEAFDIVGGHDFSRFDNGSMIYVIGLNGGASFVSNTNNFLVQNYYSYANNPFSVCVFVNVSDLTYFQDVFGYFDNVGGQSLFLTTSDYAGFFNGTPSSGTQVSLGFYDALFTDQLIKITNDNILPYNEEHVICVTYNGSKVSSDGIHIYVDGVEDTNTSSLDSGVLGDVDVGFPNGLGNTYNPLANTGEIIDEFGLWNRVLMSDEISCFNTSMYSNITYPFPMSCTSNPVPVPPIVPSTAPTGDVCASNTALAIGLLFLLALIILGFLFKKAPVFLVIGGLLAIYLGVTMIPCMGEVFGLFTLLVGIALLVLAYAQTL